MKLIHCADLHLNRPFTGMDSPVKAAAARAEQMDLLGRIAAMARKADVLLIAGDLFDNSYFDLAQLQQMREQFKGIPHVFIAPGNHDPYTPRSPYALFDFGEQVHVFRGETETVDCGSFTVTGNAGRPVGRVSLPPGKPHLLCVHGEVGGGEYNPLSPKELAPFTYCALGHVHSCSDFTENWAYSGVPLGGGFDELGQKGVIAGKMEGETRSLSFVPLPGRQYRSVTVELSRAGSYEEVEHAVFSACPEPGRDAWRIVLSGTVHPDFPFREAVLQERIGEKFYYLKLHARLHPDLSYEDMADQYTLRGLFVKEMLEQGNSRKVRRAMELGVELLEGRKPGETL